MKASAALFVLVAILTDGMTSSAAAQLPTFQPRAYISAWGGGYTSFGGFAQSVGDEDFFFNFDRDLAFGGGLHFATSPQVVIGIDGSYGTAQYQRLEIGNAEPVNRGDARVASALLSARLGAAGGERLGLYLTGGIGAFAYDLLDEPQPEFDGWDIDFAVSAGAGLDYRFIPRLGLFLEYGQVWAFHPKQGSANNTANHSLVRVGTRLGL